MFGHTLLACFRALYIMDKSIASKFWWTKVLHQAWNTIPIDMLISLVDSMPNRINAVIEADGWQTKY